MNETGFMKDIGGKDDGYKGRRGRTFEPGNR